MESVGKEDEGRARVSEKPPLERRKVHIITFTIGANAPQIARAYLTRRDARSYVRAMSRQPGNQAAWNVVEAPLWGRTFRDVYEAKQ